MRFVGTRIYLTLLPSWNVLYQLDQTLDKALGTPSAQARRVEMSQTYSITTSASTVDLIDDNTSRFPTAAQSRA